MEKIFSYTKIFTILLSVLYILGLIAGFYNLETILSIFVFIVLASIILFSKFDKKKTIILFLIFFFGMYKAHNSYNFNNTLKKIKADNIKILEQIVSSKDISNKNQRIKFYVKAKDAIIFNPKQNVEYKNLNSKILVSVDYNSEIEKKIIIGDYVEIKGKLRYPKLSTNPYQFNYKQYLLNNDCLNILYGDNETLKVLAEPEFSFKNLNESWFFILKKFEQIRLKILEKHSKNIPSDRLKILGGLVFGDETVNPDDKIKEDFKNSGLLHLLAASGLNVALIYGIWWSIASLIKIPYNFTILTGACFVVLYTFMTGFPPSIIRAGIIILFILFGKIIDRNVNSVALIFFAGFLILLFNPKMLFDVGFQLSFAVTLGLIICCPAVIEKFKKKDEEYKEKFKTKPKLLRYVYYLFSPVNLISVVLVPFVAQLWVIPLQMHYFNNFAPLSIFANIAVVPFIGILSFIGFISSIIALIPHLNTPIVCLFDSIANPLLLLLIKVSEFFASFKYSVISTIGLNFLQVFEFWGIILVLTLNLKNNFKNKKYKVSLFILMSLFILSFIQTDMFSKNPEIIMFDVENADCFLIKSPKHKYIMIDTGRKTYRGLTDAEIIINKYLKNKRINNLKHLIITHFDIDHSGGTIDILKNIKTENVIIQKEETKSEYSREILKYLNSSSINCATAKNNEIIYSEPDFEIITLKPEIKKHIDKNKIDNETSIITLLKYKNKNILFMADSGIDGFEAVKKYLPEKIDVIKIGHHGAKGVINNDMIKLIKPDYALISSKEDDYNHPHIKILNLLYSSGVKVFSSKDYGFTKFIIENDDIKFYHYNKFKRKIEKILIPKEDNSVDSYIKQFVRDNS